jgi:hypothetical protein
VVSHKDVILATLGAASAIGGLLLVFLGLLISTVETYENGLAAGVLRKFKIVGAVVTVAFLASVLTIGLSVLWLTNGQNLGIYRWVLFLFVVQLAASVVTAGWAYIDLILKAG